MFLALGVVLPTTIARMVLRLILIVVDAVALQGAGVEFYLFTYHFFCFFFNFLKWA
jgi:hypothetical protein